MTKREQLEDLVAAYLNRTADGEDPDAVERELKQGRPQLADGLERALASLRGAGLERAASASNTPDRLGEFHIEGRIGGGGMGVVYRARQTNLSRTVALKVIRADHLYLDGARARFQREAEAVARLAHPNIAALYAVGEEDAVPYCAMEFIPGVSLDVALRRVVGHRVETSPAPTCARRRPRTPATSRAASSTPACTRAAGRRAACASCARPRARWSTPTSAASCTAT